MPPTFSNLYVTGSTTKLYVKKKSVRKLSNGREITFEVLHSRREMHTVRVKKMCL